MQFPKLSSVQHISPLSWRSCYAIAAHWQKCMWCLLSIMGLWFFFSG